MAIEIAALASSVQALSAPAAGAGAAPQAGYGVSLSDLNGFEGALARAGARLEAQPVAQPSEAARQLMRPFEQINGVASRLASEAQASKASGVEMTPSEIVRLTMHCQEFMFQCQLTSNLANRTSDGLQQLFRQQA